VVEAFVEMVVDVEDGLDTGVSTAGLDNGAMSALGDEEGNVAVAAIMKIRRLFDGVAMAGTQPNAREPERRQLISGDAPITAGIRECPAPQRD
jgi:hypothetical protein